MDDERVEGEGIASARGTEPRNDMDAGVGIASAQGTGPRNDMLPGLEGAAGNPVDEATLRSEEGRELFEAAYGDAPWMEEYWTLRGEGYSWRQAAWMVWASQPKDRRVPATQREMAVSLLGLASDRAIRKWRQDNPAIEVRLRAMTISTLAKSRAEVYAALVEAASNPNPRAHADRKLALEMLGDYVPRQVVVREGMPEDLSEVDERDLSAAAAVPGLEGET